MPPIKNGFEDLKEFLQIRHDENVERLATLEANQKHIDACIDDLKKKITGIEKWMWRTTGGLAILLVIVNILIELKK